VKTPIHSIKFRTKDFESFYQKISRKKYDAPFSQCTDLSGVRVICLFKDQAERITRALKREFKIIEEIKKEKTENEFSYSSIHLIVQIKKSHTTNEKEYKELKDIFAEIQIRTILEEAWAEMEHYLNYKHIGVDKETLRKINSLSALFEIADDQFATIHNSFKAQTTKPVRSNSITPEALYHYCKKTFSWAWKNQEISGLFDVENIYGYSKLKELCDKHRITTIKQLDDIFTENKENLEKDDEKHTKEILNNPIQWPKLYQKVKKANHFYNPVTILIMMVKELE
jgi:ppGpp synthetase/RelA/SpoT-type nucleotidyltranferase